MKIRGQVCKKPPSHAIYGFQDGEGTEDSGDRPLVERQTDKRAAFSVSRGTRTRGLVDSSMALTDRDLVTQDFVSHNNGVAPLRVILRTSIDKVPRTHPSPHVIDS
ncbi:hypothetical protein ALC56_00298 [Trachymyrmex septentrionalis]|uniref:Uncharacterized protein n=1 Tax=Trachymyrmex septentrionalis TaxID=34720 RepID=A0A151K110_9HYME|nr:hypothetical protein ALC56_00298 [Trachymyrmex septentrionalis]